MNAATTLASVAANLQHASNSSSSSSSLTSSSSSHGAAAFYSSSSTAAPASLSSSPALSDLKHIPDPHAHTSESESASSSSASASSSSERSRALFADVSEWLPIADVVDAILSNQALVNDLADDEADAHASATTVCVRMVVQTFLCPYIAKILHVFMFGVCHTSMSSFPLTSPRVWLRVVSS